MDIHKLPPVRTLGTLLAENARHVEARNMLKPCWLDPLTVVFRQVGSLPVPTAERFQRRETMVRATTIARPVTSEAFAEQGSIWAADEMVFDPAPAQDQQAQDPFAGGSSPGQVLPGDVRERLSTALGGARVDENARVHDDAASDALVRREQAEAVTIGRDIFLRQGQLHPRDPEGMALLAHEMVHVLNAMRPNISWKRATVGGVHEEERAALAVEQQIRGAGLGREGYPSSTPHGVFSPGPIESLWPEIAPPPTASEPSAGQFSAERRAPSALQNVPGGGRSAGRALPPPASPTLQPMRAELDRETLYPPVARPASSAFADEERQRALYRILLRQVRSDFERGG
jgi:hypothetical protein